MEIDLDNIPLDQLDLTLVFWDEILESGSSVEEEVRMQLWSFLYNSVLDGLEIDPSDEDDTKLQAQIDEYLKSEKMKEWISQQAEEIHKFLNK
ncbi:MAG: hypothetical protein K9W44_01225 [Candidatus Lokiarchaeota archaeon]|nr:hypothetical protein [Candidatus Harpocratesius repetitus]